LNRIGFVISHINHLYSLDSLSHLLCKVEFRVDKGGLPTTEAFYWCHIICSSCYKPCYLI